MAVWLVRAGGDGAQEDLALEQNIVLIGWWELPDLSAIKTREVLEKMCREQYDDRNPNTVTNHIGQIWAFIGRISEGDLVVLPLKRRAAIAIGRVTGPYKHRPDLPREAQHTRSVEWIRQDMPRSGFDQDILYSFGAFMTVCQIQRNDAENRIKALLAGKPTPTMPLPNSTNEAESQDVQVDLERYSRDLIIKHLSQKFRGHALERLVGEVLRAKGYHVQITEAGADGGLDILAGRGPFGFDPPRLGVQVKSSDQPVDVTVLRNLNGTLGGFKAEQGLLVAWGGFKGSVLAEARRSFFNIRLWNADDLVDALLENYDKLPEELKTELPLKRIWTLVPQGE
jgi:restriction system protein